MASQLTSNLSALTSYNATFLISLGDSCDQTWTLDFFAFGAVVLATALLCFGAREYSWVVAGGWAAGGEGPGMG